MLNETSVGSTLRKLRGEKTQREISTALGVTKSSWAMYERGERIPRDEVKIEIAKYFGKSVQEIFLVRLCTYSALRNFRTKANRFHM